MAIVTLAFTRAKNVTADQARSAVREAVHTIYPLAKAELAAKQIIGPRSGVVSVDAPTDHIVAIVDAVRAAPEIEQVRHLEPMRFVRATLY